jgi:bifunctional non-homologous end joining protein LigD
MTAPTRVLEVDDRKLLLNRLDDELWPEAGVTKADLIDYYLDVADRLLPFVANRPVSLLRAPDPNMPPSDTRTTCSCPIAPPSCIW